MLIILLYYIILYCIIIILYYIVLYYTINYYVNDIHEKFIQKPIHACMQVTAELIIYSVIWTAHQFNTSF